MIQSPLQSVVDLPANSERYHNCRLILKIISNEFIIHDTGIIEFTMGVNIAFHSLLPGHIPADDVILTLHTIGSIAYEIIITISPKLLIPLVITLPSRISPGPEVAEKHISTTSGMYKKVAIHPLHDSGLQSQDYYRSFENLN